MRYIFAILICAYSLSTIGQTYSPELEKAAKSGLPSAQRQLGLCYLFGYGVKTNEKKAQDLFKKAADNRHQDSEACYWLAYMYENGLYKGKSVFMNDSYCSSYYRKAAEDRNPLAAYRMYQAFSGNSDIDRMLAIASGKKEQWLFIAAEGGVVDAIYELAHQTSDKQKKIELLKKAAEQGHESAKNEIPIIEDLIKVEQERIEAKKIEDERKRLELLALEQRNKQELQEGRYLPSLSYLRSNTIFLSWDKELKNEATKGISLFEDLFEANFNEMMGIDKMDELDLLRYKESDKFKDDLIKFDNKINQVFTYVINLDNDYPKSVTEFSTKGLTINVEFDGHTKFKQVNENHIKCWNARVYFPVQPNVAGVNDKPRRTIFFPCEDLDLLYKIKDNVKFMALVILCKPGITSSYYYFANPIAMYIVDKESGEVVLDLRNYIRDISSEAEKKKEIAYLDASLKELSAENKRLEEEWRGTYHKTPKEVSCLFCFGVGYIKKRQNDIVVDIDKCFNCHGRGYTMEHYYKD